MRHTFLYILLIAFFAASCQRNRRVETTPWGDETFADSVPTASEHFTIDELQSNGEMIMLTLTGPDSYFDYHGRGSGLQYLLCEKFARSIGVSLRVEVCKDTAEMVRRLLDGDGDIIAYQLPTSMKGLKYCGYHIDSLRSSWAVAANNVSLSASVERWYRPELVKQTLSEERRLYSSGGVRRRTFSPMLDASAGVISKYDHLFKKYAPTVRWDWRLLAAQCYQESMFDPKAESWAGACGLMQIMPTTADELGLARSMIYDPEQNVAASVRYLKMLNAELHDIANPVERRRFILASYNGGLRHLRDAMALAQKYGGDPHKWADVKDYILKLAIPQYYNDPVVKYGYMRGSETVGYVESIHSRWSQYRSKTGGSSVTVGGYGSVTPQKASKKHRFKLKD